MYITGSTAKEQTPSSSRILLAGLHAASTTAAAACHHKFCKIGPTIACTVTPTKSAGPLFLSTVANNKGLRNSLSPSLANSEKLVQIMRAREREWYLKIGRWLRLCNGIAHELRTPR
ncbi:hypothetical protein U1Q18_005351 [Sarracenia purpurea var. burkii]